MSHMEVGRNQIARFEVILLVSTTFYLSEFDLFFLFFVFIMCIVTSELWLFVILLVCILNFNS